MPLVVRGRVGDRMLPSRRAHRRRALTGVGAAPNVGGPPPYRGWDETAKREPRMTRLRRGTASWATRRHLQFEAMLTTARDSENRYGFALVTILICSGSESL
jgi:hypothetical protein